MSEIPRITFGIIVLNGEPFVPYCLRSIYSFAHQIFVVEGACQGGSAGIATSDGHSTDGTLEALYSFKENEDPENKVRIITKNGFWNEKDEQSQAYAKLAEGDYLWQVDIDEFYKPEDIQFVLDMLIGNPQVTAVSFKQLTFWGGFDYLVDGWYLRRGADRYHRLFKWGKGYQYATHRPPTVHNELGQDLRKLHWINGDEMAQRGIFLYHYSLLFPKQVIEKCEYYGNAEWAHRPLAPQWAQDVFLNLKNPYRVHNVYDHPSWLLRFTGTHPPEIVRMRSDIANGNVKVELRRTGDVERLLNSYSYRFGRAVLKRVDPWEEAWRPIWNQFLYGLKNPGKALRKIIKILTGKSAAHLL